MNAKTSPYIYTLFFILYTSSLSAQDLELKISFNESDNFGVLKKINFQKKHLDSLSIYDEINKVSKRFKKLGYFTNSINKVIKKGNQFTARFILGKKITEVVIRKKKRETLEFIGLKNNTIPIDDLESTLNKISEELESEGETFSKVNLTNLKITKNKLIADLIIVKSKKRKINKTFIKGYKFFPKSFVNHYFKINKNTIYNHNKIKEISNKSKLLNFIEEIKPPETLFKKDSTLLYLYLSKKQNNSFDGLINFTTTENNNVLFNGHLDLKLSNILNKGEEFELFWNSLGLEKQEFNIHSTIPYIFNSNLTTSLSFNIYKQDSTFLNTKFKTNIAYNINSKSKVSLTFSNETSKNLRRNTNQSNVEKFENYFVGVEYSHITPKSDNFNNKKFSIIINPSFGKRNSNGNTINQIKVELSTSYNWDLNNRSNIFIKNKTGYLKSDNLLENELFRIGGFKSIRGFNEQSIFTKNYSLFNIEYRYTTSTTSYFYTITDLARATTNTKTTNLIGLGAGYLFKIKNSQINLSTAIGKTTTSNFNLKNSKLAINWKTFF